MNRLKVQGMPKAAANPYGGKPPPLPVLNCKLSASGTTTAAAQGSPITVGQKLDLACPVQGTSLTSQSSVKFENGDASQQFVIAFLGDPKVDGDQIHQAVTSYKVGGHELSQIIATIDGKKFQLSPQNLNVQSVIQNQDPQAKPTPFPIFDPEKVAAPWWWWAIWLGLLAFIAGFFILQIVKWFKERKRAKEDLPERQKTPQEKFQERLRKLESRDLHQKGEYKAFALELTNILKTAIGAHLHFPAEDLTSEELLATLEKRFRGFFATSGTALATMFNDLDQIKFAKIETTPDKCMALLDSSLKIGRDLFGDGTAAGRGPGGAFMKWASAAAWFFLIPLVLIYVINSFRRKSRKAALQFSAVKLFNSIGPGWRARLVFIPSALKFISLFLAVAALARPQTADTKVNKNVEGIDIMITFDVSDSMEIEDMQPDNRITAAKGVIRRFIKGRGSDRIGLIIFAGESYTRVPLTLDYDILLQSLDQISTDNIKQGTAIGVALANAVARLKESTAKNRVIILLTDGENNSGTIDPETAVEIAKGYGIKIYTIGVGVNGQAQLPVYSVDAFGRKVKHYQPIHSTVNMDLLEYAAKETGAKSYRAVDTDTLKKVFADIDQLEKTKIQVNEYVRYTELFPAFLLWAAVFYLLQLVLSQTFLRRGP